MSNDPNRPVKRTLTADEVKQTEGKDLTFLRPSEPGAFTGYHEEWDDPEPEPQPPKATLGTLTECIKRFGWPFAFEPGDLDD